MNIYIYIQFLYIQGNSGHAPKMDAASRYTLCALSALCTMAQFSWCCYLAVCERRPRLSLTSAISTRNKNNNNNADHDHHVITSGNARVTSSTSAEPGKPHRPRPLTRLAACLHAAALTSATASMTLILLADDIKNSTLCKVAGMCIIMIINIE